MCCCVLLCVVVVVVVIIVVIVVVVVLLLGCWVVGLVVGALQLRVDAHNTLHEDSGSKS